MPFNLVPLSPERPQDDLTQSTARDGKHFEGPVHPTGIGATVAHFIALTFSCQFQQPATDVNAGTLLPIYIEKIVFATGFPFKVIVASLILLQRLYNRLPPDIYETRHQLSPHRLFTATYILAAKQHTQLQLGLELDRLFSPDEEGDWPNPMANTYWARHTLYALSDIKRIQRELLAVLGGNVVVFPQLDPEAQEMAKDMKAYPVTRGLPHCNPTYRPTSFNVRHGLPRLLQGYSVPNFSRLSMEEHLEMFENVARELRGMVAEGIGIGKPFYHNTVEDTKDSKFPYFRPNGRNKGKTTAWWVPQKPEDRYNS